MIPVEKARDIILSRTHTLPKEKVGLDEALARFLAEDIISDRDIPLWNNSAMDGYAVKSADVKAPDSKLKVIYDLPAGLSPQRAIKTGEAVRIMTGAPIPPGADAVVMQEDTIATKQTVTIAKTIKKSDNIRKKGEDIKKGEVILQKGEYLGPAQIGILASLQRFSIFCHQKPVVAIISTGDELSEIDTPLSPGKIASSNSYTLISLVKAAGAIPLYLGIAKDTKEDLLEIFSAAKRSDLILSSGGVSVGDYDIVKEVMKSKSNHMEFWKVEMKPGKPLAFGEIHGIPTLGLPGNPVSSMISFYQFARPALLKMQGAKTLLLPTVLAKLKTPLKKTPDRRHYVRGILKREKGELVVSTTGPQGSGILSSMSQANCLIVLPKEKTSLEKGALVECEITHASWE